jgi:hypothetical protein
MDLDSDMNATPLAKLAPAVQSRADQGRVDNPPNYSDLLNTMDVQPGRAPGVGLGNVQQPQSDDGDDDDGGDDGREYARALQMQQAAQYAHYMNQHPMQMPQMSAPQMSAAPPPPPTRRQRRPRGLSGIMRQYRDVLVVAAIAFAMLHFGAPRLRMVPGMTGPTGGLNALGLGVLALVIGFGTRVNGWL